MIPSPNLTLFRIILSFLLLGSIYGGLICVDYFVFSYTRYLSKEKVQLNHEVAKNRVTTEDTPQRNIAIEKGYLPVFFPDAIRAKNYFRQVAEELNVAPLSGQPYTNVYFCNEGYGLQKYRTDRLGFRNNDALYEKEIEIVIIGDSFGAGACVEEQFTIQSTLTEIYSRPTVSLSTGGASPIHYASVSKNYIKELKPKKVILLFYTNDRVFGDEVSYFNDFFFRQNTENPLFQPKNNRSSKLTYSKEIQKYFRKINSHLSHTVNKNTTNIAHDEPHNVGNLFDRLDKFLTLSHLSHLLRLNISSTPYSTVLAINVAVEECARFNCEVSVWFIPSSQNWDATPFSNLYREELINASKDKVRFFDLTNTLNILEGKAYAIKGGHLSPEGYRAVSAKISRELSN